MNKPVQHTRPEHDKHRRWTISLSPVAMICALAILIGAAAMLGHQLFPSSQRNQLLEQFVQLQQQNHQLTDKLSETEAKLALSKGQLAGMKQESTLLRSQNRSMQTRLDMFDDILASRKVHGIHFLRPTATWNSDDHSIAYQLILVKGENYPRWIKGHLAFSSLDSSGKAMALKTTRGKAGHKVEMTTHQFIEGKLACQDSWQPTTLKITLINHLGRVKGRIEIPITATQHIAPATHSSHINPPSTEASS